MQSEENSVRHARRITAIGVAVVLTLYMAIVFGFGLYLFAVLVSYMRNSLGFDILSVGFITGGAQIAFLAASLLCSAVTRRFGGGNVIVAAVLAAGVLLMLLSAVQNVWQMGILLIALGSCAAMMVIPTVGVVAKTVSPAWQSSVNGLISSGTAYGQFAKGLMVPFFINHYDWRAVWMVIGSVSLAAAIIGYLILRKLAAAAFETDTHQHGALRQTHLTGPRRFVALVTGRNLLVWTLLALSGIACGPWQNYLASFLGNERHFSISFIGQLWSIIGITGFVSGFAFGLLADKVGVRLVLALAFGILLSAGWLVASGGGTSALRTAAVAFGLSFYAVYGLIPAYISKTATPQTSIAIFAVANVFLGIGTSAGNTISGYLQSLSGSFQGIYSAVAAVAAIGVVFSLLLPDERLAVSQTRLCGASGDDKGDKSDNAGA